MTLCFFIARSNDVWWSWYQNKYGPTYDDFRSLYILSDEVHICSTFAFDVLVCMCVSVCFLG